MSTKAEIVSFAREARRREIGAELLSRYREFEAPEHPDWVALSRHRDDLGATEYAVFIPGHEEPLRWLCSLMAMEQCRIPADDMAVMMFEQHLLELS